MKIKVTPANPSLECKFAAESIFKIYSNWAARHNLKVFISYEELTIKFSQVSELVNNLTKESGIHRFTQISKFDKKSRRHTDFVRVEVDGICNHDNFVRNYIFSPYKRIKDYKTNIEVRGDDIELVMNGQIDPFLVG